MTTAPVDILVVDDEPVVILAVQRILAPEGYAVDEARNGEEALYKLEKNRYRLVLVDLMLPRITGFELIEIMKRRAIVSPIIVMTGYSSMESAVQSLTMGAFDYVPKPFDENELLGAVQRGVNYTDADHVGWGDRSALYTLGKHSWARFDPDGSAVMGASPWFALAVGSLGGIQFPALHDEVSQGNVCSRIVSGEGFVHTVWAPLTGLVISVNSAIEKEPALLKADPLGAGWLVRIAPTHPEEDLKRLEPN